ncbi:MAG: hypothetical protein ABI867_27500 [Kofleriaceae bacterium]
MPFKGELKRQVAYNINVDNSGSNGKTAVTIVKINKAEKFQAAETFIVDAGARAQLTDTCGLKIDRVVISIYPTKGQSIPVDVSQAGSNSEQCVGDTDLVFDLI